MPLLEVRNLQKEYVLQPGNERVQAVAGVDLTMEPGEIVGLVGESGCGKTTLGRCLLRLTEPTSGVVQFSGRSVTGASSTELRDLRRKMQIVFQDPYASLDPRWRIGDILEEPLRIHKIVPRAERRTAVQRLLADVGLPADAAVRYPHEFSGGQRQRVGIARALAVEPELLIADEPVSALDVSVRAQILNLLLDLQRKRSIAILFVGHDLAVVRQVSRRIAVMYLGKIVEQGLTDQLFEDPQHPYTRTLLSSIPSIARRHSAPPLAPAAELSARLDQVSGCRFRTRCSFAQPICATDVPPLQAHGPDPGHLAACHFAGALPPFDRPNAPPAPVGSAS